MEEENVVRFIPNEWSAKRHILKTLWDRGWLQDKDSDERLGIFILTIQHIQFTGTFPNKCPVPRILYTEDGYVNIDMEDPNGYDEDD